MGDGYDVVMFLQRRRTCGKIHGKTFFFLSDKSCKKKSFLKYFHMNIYAISEDFSRSDKILKISLFYEEKFVYTSVNELNTTMNF